MYCITGNLAATCTDYLDRTSFRIRSHYLPRVEQYMREYNTLRVCVTMISASSGTLIWFGLTCGFIVSVTSNYIGIRMRNEIPMPMYLVFPMVGFLVPITILIMLSIISSGNDKSKLILVKCKFNVHKRNVMKYVRRSVSSMQPFCLYGELIGIRLFKCNKYFKTKYFFGNVG